MGEVMGGEIDQSDTGGTGLDKVEGKAL